MALTPAQRKKIEEELEQIRQKKLHNLSLMEQERRNNLIEFFTLPKDDYGIPANPLQAELLEAWENQKYKVFVYSGANRCLGAEQLIYDPVKNKSAPVSELPSHFHVYAFDQKADEIIIANAQQPFCKGPREPLYEVTVSSGEKVICSSGHRFLTPFGYVSLSELSCGSELFSSSPIQEHVDRVHHVNDQHSTHRVGDCQYRYSACRHQYDEQLQMGANNGQEFLPLQVDVQERFYHFDRTDDQVYKCKYNHQHLFSGLHAILDVPYRSADRFFEFLSHVFYTTLKFVDEDNPKLFQFQPMFAFQLQPNIESYPSAKDALAFHQYKPDTFSSYKYPLNYSLSKAIITSIKYLRDDYKWDFTVPKYNNYLCGNVINHNTGKTTILTIICYSVMFGHWPWNNQRINFPHNKPRKVRIVGQDWEKHVKAVLLPELKKWWPKNRKLNTKKNNNGVEYYWEDVKTGSTLEIMSNLQDSDLHEGWQGDLVGYDEPPKRDVRIANARGLIDRLGRELFTMTLLKEAWVDREVVKAVDDQGRPDPTVFAINGDISVNIGFGITQEGVEQFAKTLTEEEKQARLHGKPSYLSGLVYPEFKRAYKPKGHLVERFKIPTNWMVDIAMDFHPRERQAVLFIATNERNERYGCEEIWAHGDGKAIADEIIRRINTNAYRVNRVLIDPLSKGDDQNDEQTTFKVVQKILWRHGIPLHVAAKDHRGLSSSGTLAVRSHLSGPNKEPSIWFFNDLIRTIFEFEGYMYKDGKIQDTDDHMMENLYRLLLLDTRYVDPEDEEDEEEARHDFAVNSMTGY